MFVIVPIAITIIGNFVFPSPDKMDLKKIAITINTIPPATIAK